MNADFEISGIYDEVNAAISNFCFIENICGSWHTVGDHVSDFGEIGYPFSTIEYGYASCVLESSTDDSSVHKLGTSIDGLNLIGCCREMKHYNRAVLLKYGCPGSSRYAKRRAGLITKCTKKHAGSLFWLPNFVLGCILTSECVLALLNIFFNPCCIVKICVTTSIRIVRSVLKILKILFSGIMWNVWLGKYSELNKKRFRPGLTMIALAVSSVRPFFVVSTSECCRAGGGIVEHSLELPVQSKSLLEHAKL
jgi:hypothetical protein